MAATEEQEYVRTYTFTGQRNTSKARSVDISRFTVGGDTTHTMGQITRIEFTHYHTSTGKPTRTLSGRFQFSDGTSITTYGNQQNFNGDVKLFTNSVAEDKLPEPEQWEKLTLVETINESGSIAQDGYSDSQKLYWRATSTEPMTIRVTFVVEPPTHFQPKIEQFAVGRCTEDGVMDDEGGYVATTLKISYDESQEIPEDTPIELYVYYNARSGGDLYESDYRYDLSTQWRMYLGDGKQFDKNILYGAFSGSLQWNFHCVFRIGKEQDDSTDSVGNVNAPLFISKDGNHVSVGGFPAKTDGKSFEVYAPAYLYGGIAQLGSGNILPSLGVQGGHVSIGADIEAGKTNDLWITYAKPYKTDTMPVVVASLYGGLTENIRYQGRCAAYPISSYNTGFTLRIANGGESTLPVSNTYVNWIAIGEM